MKRSPRTSTSRDAIVAAYSRFGGREMLSSQAQDYLGCYCDTRHYNKALSEDSGVATCSGWWKLGGSCLEGGGRTLQAWQER
jgi:hypothetical protein